MPYDPSSGDPIFITNGGGSGNYGGGVGAGDPGNYGGAGGAVGGTTLPGSVNLSGYTGVGSGVGYNSFTPTTNGGAQGFSNPITAPAKPYSTKNDIWYKGGLPLIAWMQSIFGNFKSGSIDATTALAQESQAQSLLYNSSYFNQSASGQAGQNLNSFKTVAQNIVNAIGLGTSTTAPGTPGTSVTCPGDPSCPTAGGSSPDTNTTILDQLQSLLNAGTASANSFEAPPNLFQVTPQSQTGSTTSNMPKILILVAVIAAGYFLYKKYA